MLSLKYYLKTSFPLFMYSQVLNSFHFILHFIPSPVSLTRYNSLQILNATLMKRSIRIRESWKTFQVKMEASWNQIFEGCLALNFDGHLDLSGLYKDWVGQVAVQLVCNVWKLHLTLWLAQ